MLSNAVKFTQFGEIAVAVRAERHPAADTADAPNTPEKIRLRISVTDTGMGIPADRIDRLFRSFSQVDASTSRQFGGTGLGLAISRRLAQAMGGDIVVASEQGVG
nr:ATP-binding protein [Micromonospora sp. DSM 115978]